MTTNILGRLYKTAREIAQRVEPHEPAEQPVEQPVERRSYPPNWLIRLMGEWGGGTTASGVNVTPDSALTFVAFYCAVDIISRAIGSLPLCLFRRRPDGGRERAVGRPIYDLIHTRPNPEQTAYAWRHAMQVWVLKGGNAYAEIARRGDGRPGALWPIDPKTMTVERESSGRLVYLQNKGLDNERRLDPENVIHVRNLGDGLVGKSPVQLFRENLGLGLAAEKAGAFLFGRGLQASGVLEHPGQLSPDAYENLTRWLETHAGLDNFARPFILEEGMTWKQQDIAPKDAQSLELRTFGVRDVARMFHIPPHKLADLADATFSNVEEMNLDWVTDGLGPWFVNWEQELAYKLLLPRERAEYYIEFVAEGLLRGNTAARSQFYREMFGIGVLSINEIREKENLNPIGPEGDVHFVPMNMTTAEEAAKPPEPPAPPEPPEPPDVEPDPEQMSVLTDLLEEAWGRIVRAEEGMVAKLQDPVRDEGHWAWAQRILTPAMRVCAASFHRPEPTLADFQGPIRAHLRTLEAERARRDDNGDLARWFADAPAVNAMSAMHALRQGEPHASPE